MKKFILPWWLMAILSIGLVMMGLAFNEKSETKCTQTYTADGANVSVKLTCDGHAATPDEIKKFLEKQNAK